MDTDTGSARTCSRLTCDQTRRIVRTSSTRPKLTADLTDSDDHIERLTWPPGLTFELVSKISSSFPALAAPVFLKLCHDSSNNHALVQRREVDRSHSQRDEAYPLGTCVGMGFTGSTGWPVTDFGVYPEVLNESRVVHVPNNQSPIGKVGLGRGGRCRTQAPERPAKRLYPITRRFRGVALGICVRDESRSAAR